MEGKRSAESNDQDHQTTVCGEESNLTRLYETIARGMISRKIDLGMDTRKVSPLDLPFLSLALPSPCHSISYQPPSSIRQSICSNTIYTTLRINLRFPPFFFTTKIFPRPDPSDTFMTFPPLTCLLPPAKKRICQQQRLITDYGSSTKQREGMKQGKGKRSTCLCVLLSRRACGLIVWMAVGGGMVEGGR